MGKDRTRVSAAPEPHRALGWSRQTWLGSVLGAALCLPTSAVASEPSSAEQLFRRGVAELHAGHYAEACPAIEQSQAAEPRLGTLLALADCLDKWGKSFSALQRHEQVIAEIERLEPEARRYRATQLEYARQAAERLRPSVPRLTLLLPRAAAAAAFELWLDGRPQPLPAAGSPLPVDPGPHTLQTRAHAHEPWTTELRLEPGEQQQVALQLGTPVTPALGAPRAVAPSASEPPQPALPTQRTHSAQPNHGAEPDVDGSPWRSVGWGLGGLGLAGVAAGSVAGLLLLDACPQLTCRRGDERARDFALATDIGFGVGLVGLVSAAIILLETAPDPDRGTRWSATAALGPGSAWLGLNQPW